jgi:hypothetical protein
MEHIKSPHDGPWETPGTDGEDRVICYRDRKGKRRTVAHVYGETEAERDARADLIVRAVNAHEGMVEALKQARIALRQSSHASYCAAEETDCGCCCGLTAACVAADAAIAKAGGRRKDGTHTDTVESGTVR